MKKRTLFAAAFISVILMSVVAGTLLFNSAKADPFPPPPTPPIIHVYLREDGSIEPSTTPIWRTGNVYALIGHFLNTTIEVLRDNLVIDGAGFILQGHSTYEGILLKDRSNVTIRNMDIKQSQTGVQIWNSSNTIVTGNKFASFNFGVYVLNGENTTVSENYFENEETDIILVGSNRSTVSKNSMSDGIRGIGIEACSADNSIFGNRISGKTDSGIAISESRNNTVYQNWIENNAVGIYINNAALNIFVTQGLTINTFRQNNLINNTASVCTQEFPASVSVQPDAGLKMKMSFEGNYWSDYNGTDTNNDGIGDTPYVINSDNIDNYPLMALFDIESSPIINTKPCPTTLVVASVVLVAAIGIGLLVYLKKRQKGSVGNG